MKLVSLNVNNFKKLNFDSPIRFKGGITVISGLNEAGKSTILDAILYALFGKVTRPPGHVKDDDLLAYQTKKCTVILEFEIDGEFYRVIREIRKTGTNKAELYKRIGQDQWKAIAAKSRDVTKAVERLLGEISFDEMLSSNVVAQKDLGRLVDPKSDRWKVVNAFLHLESFTVVSESLNEEKKNLEGTGPSRPGAVNTARERLNQLRQIAEECTRRRKLNSKSRGEIENLTKENESLENKYVELESLEAKLRGYDEILQRKQQLLSEAASKLEILNKHQQSISILEPKVLEYETELDKYQGLPDRTETSSLEEIIEVTKSDRTKLTQTQSFIETKAREVKKLEEELRPYSATDLKRLGKNKSLKPYASGLVILALAASVSFVFNIQVIPWILAAGAAIMAILLARRVSSMSNLVKQEGLEAKFCILEDKMKEMKELQGQSEQIQMSQKANEERLIKVASSLTYYTGFEIDIDPLDRADHMLKQYERDVEAKKHALESLSNAKHSLSLLRNQLDESCVSSQVSDLRAEASTLVVPALPSGLVFSREALNRTSANKESVGRSISANKSTIQSDQRTIRENERFLEEYKGIDEQLATQEALARKLERQLLITKLAKEGVERTVEAIKSRFHPGVARHMGEILPSLTLGRYKAALLDDDFAVKVFDPEAGEYRPRDVFSGGTDDQFMLAMRLAFVLSLMPEVKGTRPQFLWLDEPLGSSDEIRRSGIIEYLNTSLSKSFAQIFVVSHVGGLEEQIPNVLHLENGKIVVA